MSVLDLDFYKLTMLQFIWKHYADVPVTFRLHSRKQDLAAIVDVERLSRAILRYDDEQITDDELNCLRSLGIFEEAFLSDLERLVNNIGLTIPTIESLPSHRAVHVADSWLFVTLWETVILSAVSEQYSFEQIDPPDPIKRSADIYAIGQSGAQWADFGTRRRFGRGNHERLISELANWGSKHGFIGTSNVDMARRHRLKPIGTYAHELEMVLRNYHDTEFDTTRDVLTKWQDMYPRDLRIALTDTYTTPHFLAHHGRFLLENDWRGVRLDSGPVPAEIGLWVNRWLMQNSGEESVWDVVFSDGLSAGRIVSLQSIFSKPTFPRVNPLFGWGTGLTNPNSDLSLVMKAVESNGMKTYKVTDDETKSIR